MNTEQLCGICVLSGIQHPIGSLSNFRPALDVTLQTTRNNLGKTVLLSTWNGISYRTLHD